MVKCPDCSREFKNNSGLSAHTLHQHGSSLRTKPVRGKRVERKYTRRVRPDSEMLNYCPRCGYCVAAVRMAANA